MDKASPLPWQSIERGDDKFFLVSEEGRFLHARPMGQANTELIVKAVNQHDELVELVRDAETIISVHAAVKPEGESNVHKTMDMWLERARAVLEPQEAPDVK